LPGLLGASHAPFRDAGGHCAIEVLRQILRRPYTQADLFEKSNEILGVLCENTWNRHGSDHPIYRDGGGGVRSNWPYRSPRGQLPPQGLKRSMPE
jgi:hypothetical protein